MYSAQISAKNWANEVLSFLGAGIGLRKQKTFFFFNFLSYPENDLFRIKSAESSYI